jgi:hypothetical protein
LSSGYPPGVYGLKFMKKGDLDHDLDTWALAQD